MKMLTPFRIGLFLMFTGSIWVAFAFSSGEKISQDLSLGIKESARLDLDLKGNGIGFYKITIPDYSKEIVGVNVLDPQENFINIKRIETKMSVNYFEFESSGKYTLEITNISKNPVQLEVEFGDTKAGELALPVIMAFVGVCFLVWSGYKRLRNYSTAHPEENKP